jgi:hypothetical protein
MTKDLENTSWKEIDARNDVLTLVSNRMFFLEVPISKRLFGISWNSERFTLTVTKIDSAEEPTIRENNQCLNLSNWNYLQVDLNRPNYRILFEIGYDKEQQTLRPQVMKDAKLRFPGLAGDVRMEFA